jgi:hypothetical protein
MEPNNRVKLGKRNLKSWNAYSVLGMISPVYYPPKGSWQKLTRSRIDYPFFLGYCGGARRRWTSGLRRRTWLYGRVGWSRWKDELTWRREHKRGILRPRKHGQILKRQHYHERQSYCRKNHGSFATQAPFHFDPLLLNYKLLALERQTDSSNKRILE